MPDAQGEGHLPPYSLLYLERSLRVFDIEVFIIDERIQTAWKTDIKSISGDLILAGVSVALGNQISSAIKITQFLKEEVRAPVIWGGWLVTWMPKMCLQEPNVDFISIGQGEGPLSSLVKHLLSSDSSNSGQLSSVPGLGFKTEEKLIINQPEPFNAFLAYPSVDWSLVNLRDYIVFRKSGQAVFHYFASEGCPHQCNFCFLARGWKGKWFPNETDDIINELRYILSQAPEVSFIFFDDINFFADRGFVIDLCTKLIENRFSFSWNASGHIRSLLKDFSDEDLQLIKQAGCTSIFVGAESGDELVLKNLNKDLSVYEIGLFVEKFHRAGIKVSCSFMVLFPGHKGNDLRKTLKLIMRLLLRSEYFHCAVHTYYPLINNYYHKKAKEYNFRFPDTLTELVGFLSVQQTFPWQKKRDLNLLQYFGRFYLRYFRVHHPGQKKKSLDFKSFLAVIIRMRFKLNTTYLPVLGWIYCHLNRRSGKKDRSYHSPNSEFITGRIKSS